MASWCEYNNIRDRYAEAFFENNGAILETVQEISCWVGVAEFLFPVDECVFLCGVDTHTEYLVQDRPDSLYL